MVDSGIVEVPDPSGLFTSQGMVSPCQAPAVTVTLEVADRYSPKYRRWSLGAP